MQVALENNIVFVVIEYLAILCWGLSGGLAAIRKGYDIFTIMLCGWLTALGGSLVTGGDGFAGGADGGLQAGLHSHVAKVRLLIGEHALLLRLNVCHVYSKRCVL